MSGKSITEKFKSQSKGRKIVRRSKAPTKTRPAKKSQHEHLLEVLLAGVQEKPKTEEEVGVFEDSIKKMAVLTYKFNNDKLLTKNDPSMIMNLIDMIDLVGIVAATDELIRVSKLKREPELELLIAERIRAQAEHKYNLTIHKPEGMKIKGNCKVCDSDEVTYNSIQRRSLDEPATVTYTCVKCSNKWCVQ